MRRFGTRGLRGRFSFFVGPVAVVFWCGWGWRVWFGPTCEPRGRALWLPGVRVQFGGATPWRYKR